MSLELVIDHKGLNELIDKALDFRQTAPLMDRLGRVMLTDVDMNFKRGVSPDGTPWAPLKHRQGQPLRDTKILQNSFSYQSTEDEAVIGTNQKRGITHQFGAKQGQYGRSKRGGPLPWGDIPARPFIGIGEIQVRKINREIDRWAEGIINGN